MTEKQKNCSEETCLEVRSTDVREKELEPPKGDRNKVKDMMPLPDLTKLEKLTLLSVRDRRVLELLVGLMKLEEISLTLLKMFLNDVEPPDGLKDDDSEEFKVNQ